MYGLLLDCVQKFLRDTYGERYWALIRRKAKLTNHWFVTHEVYSESIMHDLVEAAAEELGQDKETVMTMFGEYFAENVGRYGYSRLLRVLGRDLRDFLNGLDDLHDYLKVSYPKMQQPCFHCSDETPNGLVLHYTTKRQGFLCYVIGQLKTVGGIYGKDVAISVLSEDLGEKETHYALNLEFDNREFLCKNQKVDGGLDLSISYEDFFSTFPFSLVFGSDMTVVHVGAKLGDILPGVKGRTLQEAFVLQRPHVIGDELSWRKISFHDNCTFELVSRQRVARPAASSLAELEMEEDSGVEVRCLEDGPCLKLKGEMRPLQGTEYMIFLCSPIIESPEELYQTGLFISDLPMHDSSRESILSGSQQSQNLALALNQEKLRNAQLEESVQKTDKLLYQMIPKPIADQLRNGEPPLSTCRVLPSVSILFSDVVSFTPMCSRLQPMQVVSILNAMCVAFDQLCEKHHVYKVENIGDGYMVISGAPITTPDHAEYITEFAFSIIEATGRIIDPSTSKPLRIRVGVHSGTVVAGVVGSSILRYDVFGDTVNVAARMEATGEPMRIHVSEATADLLQPTDFVLRERGHVEVKGKGMMKTYWVVGKKPAKQQPEGGSASKTLNPMQRQRTLSSADQSSRLQRDPSPRPTLTHHPSLSIPLSSLPSATNRRFTSPYIWPPSERKQHARERIASYTSVYGGLNPIPGEDFIPPVGAIEGAFFNNLSEYNLLSLQQAAGMMTTPTRGPDHAQLAAFAALADQNARQARLLADSAVRILRCTSLSPSRSPVPPNAPPAGTSVDPTDKNNSSSRCQSMTPPPATPTTSCPVSNQRTKCIVM